MKHFIALILTLFSLCLFSCEIPDKQCKERTFAEALINSNMKTIILYSDEGKELQKWTGIRNILAAGPGYAKFYDKKSQIRVIGGIILIIPDNYTLPVKKEE